MPYTPPSQQSPVASKRTSPSITRSNSYVVQPQHVQVTSPAISGPRPQLPRSSSSTSYLHRHRRSPSMTSPAITFKDGELTETPDSTPTLVNFPDHRMHHGINSSVRQSPPPVNDQPVPPGAVISPPDSAQNSSDDEATASPKRDRQLEKLAELQAAIKAIEQRKEGSPPNGLHQQDASKHRLQIDLAALTTGKEVEGGQEASQRPALSPESRKISHSRSATDSAIIDFDRQSESPDRSADSDIEDEDRVPKPPMLRKKSGELVRPALRPASARRRPSSMPGTPTYSKAVHFDSHLEHVRTFLQVDRPLAVSANTSPNEEYEEETEFPFDDTRPSWQWEIKLANFPTYVDPSPRAVRVERVFLASDNKTLVGTVAVQNLAFHKSVVARFTIDYWKTTSEVTAEFNQDYRRAAPDSLDRFNFNIKLDDLANMENRSLFFCVRYAVNGQEFWDSNNNINYQVDFGKKSTARNPQHGSSQSLNALPRSKPSPPTSGGRQRPKSASSFDDFAHGFESDFDQPGFALHDTPIKFRNRPQKVSSTLKPKIPGQAFGNRYDFGASLSAAISSATGIPGPATRNGTGSPAQTSTPPPGASAKDASSRPADLTAGKPAIQSQSYNELIDKYCFYGSAKAPTKSRRPGNGAVESEADGAQGSNVSSPASSGNPSPAPSPPAEEPLPAKSSARRSPSPATGGVERAGTPFSFGWPYYPPRSGGIFPETTTPPAIRS